MDLGYKPPKIWQHCVALLVMEESKLQLKNLFPECADWLAGFRIASQSYNNQISKAQGSGVKSCRMEQPQLLKMRVQPLLVYFSSYEAKIGFQNNGFRQNHNDLRNYNLAGLRLREIRIKQL